MRSKNMNFKYENQVRNSTSESPNLHYLIEEPNEVRVSPTKENPSVFSDVFQLYSVTFGVVEL